jgi:chromosome segregation ATPase
MQNLFKFALLGLVFILTGCATSSQVQEMIDASHRDYLDRMDAHENSIDVLKKSAMAGLEKSKENAAQLQTLQIQLDDVLKQMTIVQRNADASKLMSASNTVKVDELDEFMTDYQEKTDKIIARKGDIDKLYEEVLIQHYQLLLDSAKAAIDALKADGFSATTNAPVKLDLPIEIVAPDTAAATNTEPME